MESWRRVRGDMRRDHLAARAEATSAGSVTDAARRRLADEVGTLLAKLNC